MKKLYTHENRIIIFNLKNVLEDAGIRCSIINEFASGGAGDLATFDTWPELWVQDPKQFEEAQRIMEKIVFGEADDYWYCPACQEKNGAAFELCWKCGRSPS
jgi:rubredoxin